MQVVEANGARIPLVGLGTWDLRGKVCARMVEEAGDQRGRAGVARQAGEVAHVRSLDVRRGPQVNDKSSSELDVVAAVVARLAAGALGDAVGADRPDPLGTDGKSRPFPPPKFLRRGDIPMVASNKV